MSEAFPQVQAPESPEIQGHTLSVLDTVIEEEAHQAGLFERVSDRMSELRSNLADRTSEFARRLTPYKAVAGAVAGTLALVGVAEGLAAQADASPAGYGDGVALSKSGDTTASRKIKVHSKMTDKDITDAVVHVGPYPGPRSIHPTRTLVSDNVLSLHGDCTKNPYNPVFKLFVMKPLKKELKKTTCWGDHSTSHLAPYNNYFAQEVNRIGNDVSDGISAQNITFPSADSEKTTKSKAIVKFEYPDNLDPEAVVAKKLVVKGHSGTLTTR